MSGRYLIQLFALAVMTTLWASPAARAETLTDALRSAYKHSGLLKQNQALLRAADEDVAVAFAALYPVVDYAASVGRTDSGVTSFGTASLTVTADLLLYDGGQRRLALDAQKETVLATRESLVAVEQRILLRAVVAYMSMISATENVALSDNNVRLITQELRAARDRFEVGEVTRTDVSIAEARLASARSGFAVSQGALAQAREEYFAAVGHYPGPLVNPPAVRLGVNTLDSAKAMALQRHPDMRKAQRDVTVADINVRRADGAAKPTLNLGANVGLNKNGEGTSGVALSLRGPIYQGGKLAALFRQAVALKDASRANLFDISHDIRQNVANAWSSLIVARAAREAGDQQVRAQQVAFRGVREEATLGSRTTLDVLNAEQELLDARASLISAVTDEYVAAYTLLSSMGLLTAEHLRLGIQTYDPAAYYNAVKAAPVRSKQGQALDRIIKSLGNN